jgi:NAD+ kinase
MIIALFPNTFKKQSIEIAKNIQEFLGHQGVKVVAEDEIASSFNAHELSSVPLSSIDFIISLGGDGTILRLIHRHPELNAPIIAINLGSLGFMADIPIDEIYPSLKSLLEGKYTIQSRLVMEGRVGKNSSFAVNEIVIHRARNPCLIDLAIFVDGRYLNTFSADGVIISTPSGSTAYSLAAGGPIVTPELDAFILTPISPHTISNRAIVLMPEREIRVEYISAHDPIEITYDGFPYFTMKTAESLYITRSSRKFRLVCMPDHDYFSTLRTKLGWTGKLRGSQ